MGGQAAVEIAHVHLGLLGMYFGCFGETDAALLANGANAGLHLSEGQPSEAAKDLLPPEQSAVVNGVERMTGSSPGNQNAQSAPIAPVGISQSQSSSGGETPVRQSATGPVVGLGKTKYLSELGNVSTYQDDRWIKDGLTSWHADDPEEFWAAFNEATRNTKAIKFNLRDVDLSAKVSNLTPTLARDRNVLTEWELEQIMTNPGLLNKTTFYWPNGHVTQGSDMAQLISKYESD